MDTYTQTEIIDMLADALEDVYLTLLIVTDAEDISNNIALSKAYAALVKSGFGTWPAIYRHNEEQAKGE